jgi:cholesterol oxidase
MLGCDLHAKNTLDLNYISVADGNGADVFPLHQVHKIEPLRDQGYQVHFERFDVTDPARSTPGSVTGRKVILAAGTLGTNELLLRCRDVYGTLPNISTTLGTRFSGNGDFLLAGTMDTDRDIDPGRGPSITIGADFSTENNRIFIEDLGFPEAFMWLMEGIIPNSNHFANIFKAAGTYVLDTLGLGRGRVDFEVNRLCRGGATTRFLPYLGIGTDAADGRLTLKEESINVEWSHRRSKQMFNEIEESLRQLSRALHGRYVTSRLWSWPLRKLLTAHPLGDALWVEARKRAW